MNSANLLTLEYKNLSKGFFIGFVAAQFVSGWMSGPIILLVLFLYVFIGQAMQHVGDAIMARLPTFALNLVSRIGSGKAQETLDQNPDFWGHPSTPMYSPFQNQ